MRRLAAPLCALLVKSNLKQRPGTVKKCADICVALVELEQADTVVVRSNAAYSITRCTGGLAAK